MEHMNQIMTVGGHPENERHLDDSECHSLVSDKFSGFSILYVNVRSSTKREVVQNFLTRIGRGDTFILFRLQLQPQCDILQPHSLVCNTIV